MTLVNIVTRSTAKLSEDIAHKSVLAILYCCEFVIHSTIHTYRVSRTGQKVWVFNSEILMLVDQVRPVGPVNYFAQVFFKK